MKASKIQTYYQESFEFLQARKKRQASQLVLLSNLRRGDQNISSTLMLTLFDRVMSSIYDDKMQVKFLPSQGILQEQINDYNLLAQSDYQEMGKAKLDYDWCWDTLFFGRGYMETIRFDKEKKIMQPHVINPLNFGYDPYFDNPQEWRYYWKWIIKSKNDLLKLQKAKALKADIDINTLQGGIDPYLWDYKVKLDEAREGIAPSIQPIGGDVYQILEFYGHNEDGDKYVYWTDKNFTKILYEKKLDLKDGGEIIMPDGKSVELGSKWPIVVKEAFRVPHSSIPISIADLLEDKHRAKSVLLNLAFIAAKDEANPIYGYNPDKVRDISQFFNRQINQHIPMDDDTAAWPLNKARTMSPELQAFIQYLDAEAQEPMGAGRPMQATASSGKQTATQASLDQQLNDMAQSLQSKVMQFGEGEFWSQWFYRYARHADELKEKTANIVGVKGVDTQIIDLTQFKADFPPGVMVYSAKEAEYKDLVKRRDYMQLYPNLQQTLDPNGMRNFNKHIFFPLFLQDPSLIDIMFPKTLDEIKAEEENEQLKKNKMPQVHDADDHSSHIYMHYMVMPKTWATWTHIAWHEELLNKQKQQEKQQQAMEAQGTQSGNPQVASQAQSGVSLGQSSSSKKSPMQAASPLKSEVMSDNSKNINSNNI